jgi:hypothetical protein
MRIIFLFLLSLSSLSWGCTYCASESDVCVSWDWVCVSTSLECSAYQQVCEQSDYVCSEYDDYGDCINWNYECVSWGDQCISYQEVCDLYDFQCTRYETQCNSYYYGDYVTVRGTVRSYDTSLPLNHSLVSVAASGSSSSTRTNDNGFYTKTVFVYDDANGYLNGQVCASLDPTDRQCQTFSVYDSCSSPTVTRNFDLDVTALPPPRNFFAETANARTINVSWGSNGGMTSGFYLAWAAGSTPVSCDSVTNGFDMGAMTSYTIRNLSPSTLYTLSLCGHDSYGNRSVQITTSVTTPELAPPPPAPTSLSVQPISPSQLTASWISGGGSSLGFKVAHAEGLVAPSCSSGVNVSSSTGRSFTGLKANTVYTISVCSYNDEDTLSSSVSASVATLPLPPDLVITSFTAATSSPGVNLPSNFFVTVKNQGQVTANNFNVSLYNYLNSAPTPGTDTSGTPVVVVPVASLAGGQSITVTLTTYFGQTGTKKVWALADSSAVISESNESNNAAGPLNVTAVIPKAELFISSLVPVTSPLAVSKPISFNITVKNTGLLSANNFRVSLYNNLSVAPTKSTTASKYTTISSLAAGTTTVVTLTTSYGTVGSKKTWAYVDTGSAVAESNESNNIAGPLTVNIINPKPDLAISSVGASTKTPFAQQAVNFTITVRNQGTLAANNFKVALYNHSTTKPTASTAANASVIIPSLAAGQSTTVTLTTAYGVKGTKSSWVLVDSSNVVSESSETNNANGPIFVTVR